MKQIKTTVQQEKEVVAVQITEEEFADIAAQECTKIAETLMNTGEPSEIDILVPLMCAKYAARVCSRIFKTEESEENENA